MIEYPDASKSAPPLRPQLQARAQVDTRHSSQFHELVSL